MPPSTDGAPSAPSPGRPSAPSRRNTDPALSLVHERDSAAEMKRDAKRARAALRSLQKRSSVLRLQQASGAPDSVPPVGEDVRRTVSADQALVAPLLAEVRKCLCSRSLVVFGAHPLLLRCGRCGPP